MDSIVQILDESGGRNCELYKVQFRKAFKTYIIGEFGKRDSQK